MGRAQTDWMRSPPEKADGERAKEALLEQHVRVRVVLDELDRYALAVIRDGSLSRAELATALEATSSWLGEAMSDEEQSLEQVLPRTGDGTETLAHLREEHERQRDELGAMQRLARTTGDAITLALAVRGFVSDARLDWDAEERLIFPEDSA